MSAPMSDPIPRSYQAWRHCIEQDCGIALTPAYVAARLQILQQKEEQETARFIRLYGELHWRNVVTWFAQVQTQWSR
ncbi:hypothetical protein PQR62_22755 [Herbaspirillum lusitanum]|jgi:hypothetical protein|uniref:Uncharacterized protein n=1 Tax=Herbaspirillum lusitanum TaxID=213312 RepID=A0ABW9AEV8_9BURK